MMITIWQTLLLILCALTGAVMVEVEAVSKRSNDDAFSVRYYLRRNAWGIAWNLLGVALLLLSHRIILAVVLWGLNKLDMGIDWMLYIIPPTGAAIGYGGGRLVRFLLRKGADKVGAGGAFDDEGGQ